MFSRAAQLASVGWCFCSAPLLAGTIYVDAAATGTNDGMSIPAIARILHHSRRKIREALACPSWRWLR